jgi:hypothetical protein
LIKLTLHELGEGTRGVDRESLVANRFSIVCPKHGVKTDGRVGGALKSGSLPLPLGLDPVTIDDYSHAGSSHVGIYDRAFFES